MEAGSHFDTAAPAGQAAASVPIELCEPGRQLGGAPSLSLGHP
jgi:hypothetical protein